MPRRLLMRRGGLPLRGGGWVLAVVQGREGRTYDDVAVLECFPLRGFDQAGFGQGGKRATYG